MRPHAIRVSLDISRSALLLIAPQATAFDAARSPQRPPTHGAGGIAASDRRVSRKLRNIRKHAPRSSRKPRLLGSIARSGGP